MTIRVVYRPSSQRGPTVQTKAAIRGQGDAAIETPPAAPAARWSQSTLESMILLQARLATVAVGLAVWRIASDLGLSWGFPLNAGVLSHWQVWFAVGLLLSGGASALSRRLRLTHAEAPRTNHVQAA